MIIECSISGCLPRPNPLITETRKFDRFMITEEKLEAAFRKYTEEVIKFQVDHGLTYINDGFLKRQDLLRPFSSKLIGVKVGQLDRWFDNNIFYRVPVIKEKISGSPPYNETYLGLLPKKKLKAILPAPYTFYKLSRNEGYKNEIKFLFDIAEVLNSEIKYLEGQGYEYIQLSDPALVYHKTIPDKEQLGIIEEAIEIVTKGVKSRIGIQTFFGDISPMLAELLDWKVDDIGFDLYETDHHLIKEYRFKKGLSLGLVNSRNTLREDPIELVDICMNILSSSSPERLIVSTNCDLDFLPWSIAKLKIATVTSIASKLREAL
jgi:5-methyltetrahydropteroyltriglutamate--homocysteine methyltransferase